MKRLVMIISLVTALTVMAGNNPTNPNSSYKNQYPKGGKGTKEIRQDQVNRNYKQQGPLKVNRTEAGNVQKAETTKGSYKHPFGL